MAGLPKRLQSILDQLEADDLRFQKRARNHVLKLYRDLNLKDLQRLLSSVLAQPKAKRMKALDRLLTVFDEATKELKLPPKVIRLLLKEAADKQILSTDAVLKALDPKFSFNQGRDLQRQYAARAQKDFDRYWSKESKRFRKDIQSVLRKATRLGWSEERTQREIQERTGVSRSRAELIAVDQAQKARAYADQERQESLGIKRYTWRTVGDSRVRRDHQLRSGKVFEWAKPPPDGHAGWAIRCRCRAVPYLGAERMQE